MKAFGFRVSGIGYRVSGFGFRVSGIGFWVSGIGYRVSGIGSQVSGIGFRVSGFGFRVSGFEFRVSGFGYRVLGFGYRVSGFGYRVSGFGFRVRCSSIDGGGYARTLAEGARIREDTLRFGYRVPFFIYIFRVSGTRFILGIGFRFGYRVWGVGGTLFFDRRGRVREDARGGQRLLQRLQKPAAINMCVKYIVTCVNLSIRCILGDR